MENDLPFCDELEDSSSSSNSKGPVITQQHSSTGEQECLLAFLLILVSASVVALWCYNKITDSGSRWTRRRRRGGRGHRIKRATDEDYAPDFHSAVMNYIAEELDRYSTVEPEMRVHVSFLYLNAYAN